MRKEMLGIMDEVEFQETCRLLRRGRTGEWNYYPDTDEGRQAYIDDATAAIDNLKALCPSILASCQKLI